MSVGIIGREKETVSEEKNKEEYLHLISKMLDEIQFGSITIVIQNGKIMQVQKEEKIRI